ncbi:MAG: DUF58 domain-containing protein [Thermoplasmataceae archaeon]
MIKEWSKQLITLVLLAAVIAAIAIIATEKTLILGIFFPIIFVLIILYTVKDVQISLSVQSPQRLKVGEEAYFYVKIVSKGGFGLFNITLPTFSEMEIVEGTNVCLMFKSFREREKEVSYKIRTTRRGIFDLSNTEITYIPVIGVVKSERITIQTSKTIEVVPAITMLKKSQFQFRSKVIKPRIAISRLGPPSNDFESIRDYIPGDPYKTINWKATARRNSQEKLLVNVYEREGMKTFIFILDRGPNMLSGSSSNNPLEYSIPLILSGAKYLTSKGSNVGFWETKTFSETKAPYIQPSSGADTYTKLRRILIRVEAVRNKNIKYKSDKTLSHIIAETLPQVMLITSLNESNYGNIAEFSSSLMSSGARLTIMDILSEGISAKYRREDISGLFQRKIIKNTKSGIYKAFPSGCTIVQWEPISENLGIAAARLAMLSGW